jgi:hypothetical protein
MGGVLLAVPTTISMSQKSRKDRQKEGCREARSHIMLLIVVIREGAWSAFRMAASGLTPLTRINQDGRFFQRCHIALRCPDLNNCAIFFPGG